MALIENGIDTIFYPCIPYEKKEYCDSNNHYNCPMVTSYPEVIKNNMDILEEKNIKFIAPFFSLDDEKVLAKRIVEEFKEYGVTHKEAKEAVAKAFIERQNYRNDIRNKGKEVV